MNNQLHQRDNLLRLYRNVKLKAHFGSSKQDKFKLRLKSKSIWTTDKLSSCVDTFITAADHDIKKLFSETYS